MEAIVVKADPEPSTPSRQQLWEAAAYPSGGVFCERKGHESAIVLEEG